MHRRGLTLIELLIGLCITALVTTMLVQLMLASRHAWIRSDQRSDALQNALLVMTRVRDEVRDANPDSTLYIPSPHDGLLLLSWRVWDGTQMQWDTTGQVLWQSVVAIYLDVPTHRVLMRERLLPSPTADPPTLQPADFDPQAGDKIHVLAHDIESLTFEPQSATVVGVHVVAMVGSAECPLDGSAMATVPSANTSPTP